MRNKRTLLDAPFGIFYMHFKKFLIEKQKRYGRKERGKKKCFWLQSLAISAFNKQFSIGS